MRRGFRSTQVTRLTRVVITAFVMVALGLPMLAGGAHAGSEADAALDLAAMALRPTDLEAEDLVGYGLANSVQTEDPEAAADFFALWREDPDEARAEGIEEADPDRTYILNLMLSVREGDPVRGTAAVIRSYIFEFENVEAAEAAFGVLAEAWQSGDMEEAELEAEIGDESILVTGTGQDAQEPNDFDWSDLLFRSDNIIAGVSVEAFTETLPEPEVVEALAERQMERIEDVRDNGAPGLGNMILRLQVPGEGAIFDQYEVRDREPFYSVYETREAFEESQNEPAEMGMINTYNFQQQIGGSAFGPIEPPVAYYYVRIVQFDDEDAASAYLESRVANLQDAVDEYDEVDDVSDLGDEAVGLTYQHAVGEVRFDDYRVYARVGATFFTMAINTTEDLDTEAFDELVEQQAACIAGDETCLDAVPLPDELDVSASGATFAKTLGSSRTESPALARSDSGGVGHRRLASL